MPCGEVLQQAPQGAWVGDHQAQHQHLPAAFRDRGRGLGHPRLCPEPCQHLASVVTISLLPPSSGDSRTWFNCEQKRTRSKPWSHLRWFQSARAEAAPPELNQGYPEATGALSHLCPRTWLLVLQSKSTQQDLAQRLPHGRDAPSPTAGTEASQGVRHVPSSPPAAAGRSRGHRMASKPSTGAKRAPLVFTGLPRHRSLPRPPPLRPVRRLFLVPSLLC